MSCSNQLTVFPVQYLLHLESVLAEVVGVHDELAAWEFVAAAVKNIEKYPHTLETTKMVLNSIAYPSHSKLV